MMVVAGNMREFQEFKKLNEGKYDEIYFVDSTESLKGVRDSFITFYGTFYKRLDYGRIEEEVGWRLKVGDLKVKGGM
jgi:hypothetical protein